MVRQGGGSRKKAGIPFEIIPGISSSVAGQPTLGFLLHTVIVVLS